MLISIFFVKCYLYGKSDRFWFKIFSILYVGSIIDFRGRERENMYEKYLVRGSKNWIWIISYYEECDFMFG